LQPAWLEKILVAGVRSRSVMVRLPSASALPVFSF